MFHSLAYRLISIELLSLQIILACVKLIKHLPAHCLRQSLPNTTARPSGEGLTFHSEPLFTHVPALYQPASAVVREGLFSLTVSEGWLQVVFSAAVGCGSTGHHGGSIWHSRATYLKEVERQQEEEP